jgi:glycosyl transferase family 25
MEDQLEGAGLSHEFVEAVDGQALTRSERASLVDEAAVAQFPEWLTPGMIGCSLSHLRVYEQIIADGEEISLVLEDDVRLPQGIADTAAEVAAHMSGSEVVLMYFRSFGACALSARDSTPLSGGMQLLYPMKVSQPVTTGAYLITPEACRRLTEVILPIRVGPDSWGEFYELDVIQSLRCVLPRPVTMRKEFKSTITRSSARRSDRITGFVARHHIFPLFQLLTLNRYLIERRMSRIDIVPERSPIALGLSANTA